MLEGGEFRVFLEDFIMKVIGECFKEPGREPHTGNLVNRIEVGIDKCLPLEDNIIIKFLVIGEEVC